MSLASTLRTDELLSLGADTCEFFIKVYETDGDSVRVDISANESLSTFRSELLERERIKNCD